MSTKRSIYYHDDVDPYVHVYEELVAMGFKEIEAESILRYANWGRKINERNMSQRHVMKLENHVRDGVDAKSVRDGVV